MGNKEGHGSGSCLESPFRGSGQWVVEPLEWRDSESKVSTFYPYYLEGLS